MADPVTAFIAWAGSAIGGTAGATLIMYSTQIASAVILASTIAASGYSQRRAEGKARDAWNASLRDRYIMVRGAAEPRQVVLGRQRVSGPITFVHTYGADRERLVLVVVLASHECDAVESIYIDDEQAQLDGSGNVTGVYRSDTFTMTGATGTFTATTAPLDGSMVATVAYGSTSVTLAAVVTGTSVALSGGTPLLTGTVRLRYLPKKSPYASGNPNIDQTAALATNGSGTGSVTLPATPDPATVRVDYVVSAESVDEGGVTQAVLASVPFSLVGATVTVTGSTYTNASLVVSYRTTASASRMRVRSYTGAAGQAADAALVAALPGIWTSDHRMQGMCYLVVECDFDPNAFPAGIPNVSAVVRGAKLYDPRDGTTVWSENPALMMRYVALSQLLGRQPAGMVDDTSISAAATACAASVNYVVNSRTFTRPIYTAGTVLKSGVRAKDALDDLAAAMAGRWCVIDGKLRVRSGTYATPLQTLTDAWLVAEQAVQVQARPPRQDCINVITGMFSDQEQAWQVVDYPRVSSPAWVTADGAELPMDLPLGAVTFGPQAQQVAAVMLRDGRQGLRLSITCNLRAYAVEVFDVINVTLSRFGWVDKPFEVLDISWTLDGGIQLQLKETDASTYALGTSFSATDPAPNTRLASPWEVPDVVALAAASGTAHLLRGNDGSITARVLVTWQPITDSAITTAGGVEVRWGLVSQPESQWQTVRAEQGQTQTHLLGMRDGQVIAIKARAFNALVRGDWSPLVLHAVVGESAPPADVQAFTLMEWPQGGRLYYWDMPAEVDLAGFEARYCDVTLDLPWPLMTPLWEAGRLDRSRDAQTPIDGEWVIAIKARDTSGNESVNDKRLAVLLDAQSFGSPLASVDAGALGWPGTKTGCAKVSYYLADIGTLTWDTIPVSWDSWASWDGPSSSPIVYQHGTVDVGSTLTLRMRGGQVASGSVSAEYQSSTDDITYTAWAALPAGTFSARYVRVRWTISGVSPILYRARFTLYA